MHVLSLCKVAATTSVCRASGKVPLGREEALHLDWDFHIPRIDVAAPSGTGLSGYAQSFHLARCTIL